MNHFQRSHRKFCGNKHKLNKIEKIRKLTGENPKIRFIATNLSEAEAFDLEKKVIAENSSHLTNKTDGGEGGSGYVFPKGKHPQSGKPLSKSHREKIRVALTGRKLPESVREKISSANRNRKYPKEALEKIRTRLLGKKQSNETRERKSVSNSRYTYRIVSPSGKVYCNMPSLRLFCKENNLSYHSFRKCVTVGRSICNNWKISWAENN